MNDRELLEMAAKAADLPMHRYCEAWKAMARYTLQDGYHGPSWNPLADDGDALRLASRLLIDMQFFSDDGGFVQAWCLPISDWLREDDLGDFPAATRRAIVRAAAEIGKGMP